MLYPFISRSVLVLDSDPEESDLLLQAFAAEDYAIQFVETLQQVLEAVRHSPPALLVIEDTALGLRLRDFVARLQARRPNLPVAIIAGPEWDRWIECDERFCVVRKPLTAHVILERIIPLAPRESESAAYQLVTLT